MNTPADSISITWTIGDVQQERPDLNDTQAYEVLKRAEQKHDAAVGINWAVLCAHAQILYPRPGGPLKLPSATPMLDWLDAMREEPAEKE